MNEMHVVLAPVGADVYAVPIDRVRQVVVAPALTRLVTAPPHVLGLFSLRGQIVPLLDTSALLGFGAPVPCEFVLVLHSPEGLFGLTTTALPERARLGARAGSSELPGTDGTYLHGESTVVLLDVDALLTGERIVGEQVRRESGGVVSSGAR